MSCPGKEKYQHTSSLLKYLPKTINYYSGVNIYPVRVNMTPKTVRRTTG